MANLNINNLDKHPFGNGQTSKKIVREIKKFLKNDYESKKFYDLGLD